MQKTTRTLLAFDERQLDQIASLREAFAIGDKKDISNKELLLIAMSIGFASKNRLQDFKRSNTGVRMEYFKPEDNVLFAALQVAETGDSKSLLEIERLYDLVEQYCAGGISVLHHAYLNENNFDQWFQAFVYSGLVEYGNDGES